MSVDDAPLDPQVADHTTTDTLEKFTNSKARDNKVCRRSRPNDGRKLEGVMDGWAERIVLEAASK
jgi:hypothetical protein